MTGQIYLESNLVSVLETEGQAFVPIVRTGDLSGPVTIEYGITDDTATNGQDYLATTGTVTMQPGQSRITVPVTVLDDAQGEATEAFVFSIINVDSGTLNAPRTTRVDILDNENPVTEPSDPPLVSDYKVDMVDTVTGLNAPMAMEFSPADPSQVYIAEKGGKIILAKADGSGARETVLDISSITNSLQDRGIMDIALHPDFEENPYLYVFHVVDPADTAGKSGNAGPDGGGNRYAHVVRYTLDADNDYKSVVDGSDVIIAGSAGRSLADISGSGAVDSTSNFTQAESGRTSDGGYVDDYLKMDSRSHIGGSLEFGPDGALYISTGDGTSYNAADPRSASVQSLDSLAGKILRVDPMTGEGLADNPFVEEGMDLSINQAKVYQLGLRNPFSMSFDSEGKLLITDTGWNSWEEINSGGPGANFGWPFFEGGDLGEIRQTNGYRDMPGAQAFYDAVERGDITITPALRAFAHSASEAGFQVQAIAGSDDLLDSELYPEALRNDYVFTDYSQGEIYSVDPNDRRDVNFLYKTASGFGPVHYKMGEDGYLYYADLVRGTIGRMEIRDPSEDAPVASGSIQAEYFTANASVLADVNFLSNPIHTESVTSIQQDAGSNAFYSGGPADQFAVRYSGEFAVGKAGYYTFHLNSDDGSRLSIDGKQLIANDGLHSAVEVSSTVYLVAGTHTFEADYFEQTGEAVMELDWTGPDFTRTAFAVSGETVGNVVQDIPSETQELRGTAETDVFAINGPAADYGWGPTEDGLGVVVWNNQSGAFDLLYDFDKIRFSDVEVDLVPAGNEYFDVPGVTEFLTGTGVETFVIDGLSAAHGWGPTEDGKGTVVWNNETGAFDLLTDFKEIRFSDKVVELAAPGETGVVNDDPSRTQFLYGTEATETFVIAGSSANFGWGPAEDGLGVVIWNKQSGAFDLLYDFDVLKFDDVEVDLNAPARDQLVIDNIPGEPQYLFGTSGQDQFVIDGQSTDFGWEATDDGGYVVWEVSSGDFDILYGFEDIVFNDTTAVIG
jgi:glucose/arabinose dehydrogenase